MKKSIFWGFWAVFLLLLGNTLTAQTITTQPSDQTVTYGNDATFTIATDDASATYQWQVNDGSGFTDLTGETGTSLTITKPTVDMSGYIYHCVVTWSDGTTSPTTSDDVTLTVNPAALTASGVTASSKTYDGTTDATIDYSNASLTGMVNGDAEPTITSATGTFADANAGTNKNITVNLVLNDANYYVAPFTVQADITAKELTVTGLSAKNKVYDGNTTAELNFAGVTLNGVVSGDNVALDETNYTATFADKNVNTGINVTVTLSLLNNDAGNYTLTQPTGLTANITPKTLTVSGLTVKSKEYDGALAATLNNDGSLVGVVSPDDVSIDYTNATASFTTKDAGTNKTVTVSGLKLSGTDAGNYTITQPTLTGTITQKAITITGISVLDKEYDGGTLATLDYTNAQLQNLVSGDAVDPDFSNYTANFNDKNVGDNIPVNVSGIGLTNTDAGNYTLTQPTGLTGKILAKQLTIDGLVVEDKVYDGTTDATLDYSSATLVGVVPSETVTADYSNATATFTSKNVASGIDVNVSGITLGGVDAGNYTLAQPTGLKASITQKTITISGLTVSSKVYDGTKDATVDHTGATLVGTYQTDDVNPDFTNMIALFDDKTAGTGKTVTITGIALTGTDAANYKLTQPTLTADITKRVLTIDGLLVKDKVYDATPDATLDYNSATLQNKVSGDDVSADYVSAVVAFVDKNVGTNKSVNFTTDIPLTGNDAANYTLTQPTLTGNITPAPLSVTGLLVKDKEYDGTNTAVLDYSNAKLTGVLGSDNVTADFASALASFLDGSIGNDKPVTIVVPLNGSDAGNYELSLDGYTASITPKTLTVTGLQVIDKTYDGTTDATLDFTNAKLTGIVGSEDVSIDETNSTASFVDANAGSQIDVNVTIALAGADKANYTISSFTLQGNILQATPVITWDNPADISAGTALSATQLNATADVAGTFVYDPAEGAVLPIGHNQALNCTFTPDDATNYTTAQATVYINVLDTNATLSDLKVDGTTIDGFNPDTLTYDVELAAGTTTVPTVEATPASTLATAQVTDATELPGSTTVTVTAEDGTVLTYTINFTVATDINELNANVSISPNPTNGIIRIEAKGNYSVTIFGVNGKIINSLEMNNTASINISDKPNGVYIIRLRSGKNVMDYKIIKE